MASGGTSPGIDKRVIYSIQRTYIIKGVLKSEMPILTCDERIDIPTIEPLSHMKPTVYPDVALTVVPCIELTGYFWDFCDLTFETNEGVTVLPIKIEPKHNPYTQFRYVLVLPRGATGVKSCKIIQKGDGKEVQHNFTFGIMPPPYNYDNALFGFISARAADNSEYISILEEEVTNLDARVRALENKAGG